MRSSASALRLAPTSADVFEHTGRTDRAYFNKVLRKMHSQRSVELSADESNVIVLPPGSTRLEALVLAHLESPKPKPAKRKRR